MDLNQYRLNRTEAFLLTIDVQEKLAPAMDRTEFCTGRVVRMLKAAEIFGLPGCLTEQYPKGLGASMPAVQAAAAACSHPVFDKVQFNAMTETVTACIEASGRRSVVVTGIETHICVFQTVRALLAAGYRVFVPEDAVSSRTADNRRNALRMMRDMGACITNTETLLFDLMGAAGGPEFKAVSALVK